MPVKKRQLISERWSSWSTTDIDKQRLCQWLQSNCPKLSSAAHMISEKKYSTIYIVDLASIPIVLEPTTWENAITYLLKLRLGLVECVRIWKFYIFYSKNKILVRHCTKMRNIICPAQLALNVKYCCLTIRKNQLREYKWCGRLSTIIMSSVLSLQQIINSLAGGKYSRYLEKTHTRIFWVFSPFMSPR